MKAKTSVKKIAIAAVLAGSAGIFVQSQTEESGPLPAKALPMMTSSQFLLNGEVSARTETDFTVVNKAGQTTTVLVTDDTTITKGAATIKLADLTVGDKVSVTVMRAADGKLQAAKVLVREPYD